MLSIAEAIRPLPMGEVTELAGFGLMFIKKTL
jgi:hypothetical protein